MEDLYKREAVGTRIVGIVLRSNPAPIIYQEGAPQVHPQFPDYNPYLEHPVSDPDDDDADDSDLDGPDIPYLSQEWEVEG